MIRISRQKTAGGESRPPFTGVRTMSLALLILAYSARRATGAGLTNTIEFANEVPAVGSVQWEDRQRIIQLRQDSYRQRLAIPEAMSPYAPRAASAILINGPDTPPVQPEPPETVRNVFDVFFFAVVLALTGGLLARRFAPQLLVSLNQHCNPWAGPPDETHGSEQTVLSEEKPFNEFLASLRTGPAGSATAATTSDSPQAELYAQMGPRLATQRKLLEQLRREASDVDRKKSLVNLYFEFGVLKDSANFPEALPIWRLASALEGLLKEHVGKIRNTTPSTLRTIEGGLDLLDQLCRPGLKPGALTDRPLKFLVVDDELISRHALSFSLKKAFSEPDLATDAASALSQTAQQAYDVIFLDVEMPGMDGFELCEKIHISELNHNTPVVFVTNNSDFDARAKATLVGGHDLLGKPFLIFEITTKALTLALKGRLHALAAPASPSAESTRRPTTPAAAPLLQRPLNQPANVSPAAVTANNTVRYATGEFLDRAFEHLDPLREVCQNLQQVTEVAVRQNLLTDAFLRLNSMTADAANVVHPACQLGHALEGLIRKLLQDSARSTPATLATIATSVDLLHDLCSPGLKPDLAMNPPIHLLVVDDDLVARRSLAGALQTVFEKPATAADGESALALANDERFDVIFLDVQMPGMNGFETCAKIRAAGGNRETPVVFVTAHTDLANRDEITRVGGDDLVTKPFLTAEIQVKALAFALRHRLSQSKTSFAA